MSDKQSLIQRLKQIRKRDRNVILICVGIALIFWLTNALSESYTHDYSFNLDYQLLENVSFASAPREKIDARISGQGWELLRASFKRGFKYVPVSVLRPEITRSDLIAAVNEHLSDYDIVVRSVNVDVMTLDITMVLTKSVPIQYEPNVVCAEGFVFLDTAHLEPATVTVTGPSSLIERMDPITIQQVSVDPLNADLNQVVNVTLPEQDYIKIEPATVNLVAAVEREVRITTEIPVEPKGDTVFYKIDIPRVSITCSVGESKQNDIDFNSIKAIVNINADAVSSGNCPVELRDVPPIVTAIRCVPDTVRLQERDR